MTNPVSPSALDPVTLEVIRYGLVSICNQIDANIKPRSVPTSMSTTISP